jgi:hypothetical protein
MIVTIVYVSGEHQLLLSAGHAWFVSATLSCLLLCDYPMHDGESVFASTRSTLLFA